MPSSFVKCYPLPLFGMPNKHESTAIPTKGKAAHLGAIAYLAVLAYPNRSEWRMRDQFVEACKALMLQIAVKRGYPRWEIYPRYRKMRPEQMHSRISRAFRRIYSRRLFAVYVASWPILSRTKVGPFSIKAPATIRAGLKVGLVDYVRDYEDLDSDAFWNRYRLQWAESLPVLHLTWVIAGLLQKEQSNPMQLIYRPHWVRRALKASELLRVKLPDLLKGQPIGRTVFNPSTAIHLIPQQ